MPAIFFAGQVDGVRSLPPHAAADATQDAAQVAAKTEVGCTQLRVVANHPEHRVDAHDGVRPFLYRLERGYAANRTWSPQSRTQAVSHQLYGHY